MTQSHVDAEILSQPEMWQAAAELAAATPAAFPQKGERVAVVGCGTSWFIAMAYASLREAAGQGETDAFAGSEFLPDRPYDAVVAITRSGTTSEIVDVLGQVEGKTRRITITGVVDSPVASRTEELIDLSFADEQSVVQTRFATSALSLLRASLGEDLAGVIADGRAALEVPVDEFVPSEQITFLGHAWTVGLAHEAALKNREASQFWAEAYPAWDYRHGPISIAQAGRITWAFGEVPEGLDGEIAAAGATFVHHAELDPQASLVVAQRLAIAKAVAKGLNPDQPRNLTRSVILDENA